MNVPLNWLAEYVKLPKDIKVLTDQLTSVGHMLDKTTQVGSNMVIDLELRGNRADMFGLIGIAREVAAITRAPLKLPPVAKLAKVDPQSPLVNIQPSAIDLVKRYLAVKLSVSVGPSPRWLVDRLEAYGIPAVNNVVDITNYVMVETSHPLHAFDLAKIAGGQLVLRRAKPAEKFTTIQQGTTLILTANDLVISDTKEVHGLSTIGGWNSRVTEKTTEIILESAVYNPAASRKTARRLKTITESGLRHEKHQDPNGVEFALARAVYLIQQLAKGKIEGLVSNYYPHPVKARSINFDYRQVARLTGVKIPTPTITSLLAALGFEARPGKVIVPSWRTDVEQSADLVEEVIRMYGYDRIPQTPLTDATPVPQTYPSYTLVEKVRDLCLRLALDEVITLTMVERGEVKLVNPPDPALGYLRAEIAPSLVKYARRLLNLRQKRVAIFEVGKIFSGKKSKYTESLRLAIAVAGDLPDLTGRLQGLATLLGVDDIPARVGEDSGIFWADIDLDKLQPLLPEFANPYQVVSAYPPIIEDVNVTYRGSYGELIKRIKRLSNLIKDIELIDKYDNKLTLRITYHSNSRQLSSSDIAPIREKIAAGESRPKVG